MIPKYYMYIYIYTCVLESISSNQNSHSKRWRVGELNMQICTRTRKKSTFKKFEDEYII